VDGREFYVRFKKEGVYSVNFTLVACATRCTLTIVPFLDAVARYIPLEEKVIAANGD
jgi:hypothetical protein